MLKRVPPEIEREILRLAAKGETCRAISDALKAQHAFSCSFQCVARILRQTRVSRGETARAVTREVLASHLVGDLDVLAEERERLTSLSVRIHKRAHQKFDAIEQLESDPRPKNKGTEERLRSLVNAAHATADLALKASDRVRTVIDTKLHFAGADEPASDAEQNGQRIQDDLIGRLSRLAATEDQREDHPEPQPQGG